MQHTATSFNCEKRTTGNQQIIVNRLSFAKGKNFDI